MLERVALYLQDSHDLRDGLDYVRYAEERGFEAVWQAESRLVRDAIVPMAAYAAVTEKLIVGSGVINNWTRNIGLLAATADACWCVETPFLPMDPMPHGSGDAISALFLAHYLRNAGAATRVPDSLAAAAAAIFAIMNATAAAGGTELALIAAQDDIVNPPRRFPARQVA